MVGFTSQFMELGNYGLLECLGAMSQGNRQLLTNESVEFVKQSMKVRNFRLIVDPFSNKISISNKR